MRSLILFPFLLISAVAFAALYSPKHQEFVNSLRKVRTPSALTIQLPSLVVPPRPTNLYYLHLQWDTNCTSVAEFSWGTNNGFQNTNIFSGGDCRVSNLVFGPVYQFRTLTNCSPGSVTTFYFPPVQPPFTNYVWIGATNWAGEILTNPLPQTQFYKVTNGLLYGFNSLSGQWLRMDVVTTPSGTKNLWLQMDTSNNQIPYGKFMHKQ